MYINRHVETMYELEGEEIGKSFRILILLYVLKGRVAQVVCLA